MLPKQFDIIKYKIIRFIEKYPSISILIYNNISFFKFLLPHEKDYFGILKLVKNCKNCSLIDVGANNGISSMGFRKLGFVNPIYLFEPNFFLYSNYLKNLQKKNDNMYIKNFALGNQNKTKKLFVAYYKKRSIHFLSSFDKSYIINSIKITFPNYLNKINIVHRKIRCFKLDSLKLKYPPCFIKLDTEGNDFNVLKGSKKTIKKYKPIFLIEYNQEYHHKISKLLKNYKTLIYDYGKDKFLNINSKTKKQISRTSKNNYLSNRNIYFVPK